MLRKNWINSFGPDKVIQLVETKGERSLYVTHSKEYDGRASMYHVWEGDDWLYCGVNYIAAKEYLDDVG